MITLQRERWARLWLGFFLAACVYLVITKRNVCTIVRAQVNVAAKKLLTFTNKIKTNSSNQSLENVYLYAMSDQCR